ncbi:hypothetical protein [Arthrobacter methylotrophus]|uniref:hypothetical protein n=1 Tax=Arthrobacter methylotrophus TaxID=121291 RepID=UPI0031EB9C11
MGGPSGTGQPLDGGGKGAQAMVAVEDPEGRCRTPIVIKPIGTQQSFEYVKL